MHYVCTFPYQDFWFWLFLLHLILSLLPPLPQLQNVKEVLDSL